MSENQTIAAFKELRRRCMYDDHDYWILNTGKERLGGKSNTAFWIGKEVDPDFGPHRILYSTEDLMTRVPEGPKGAVWILDESVDGALGMDWNSTGGKDFVKWAKVAGKYNAIIIITDPSIDSINKYLREKRGSHWIQNRTRTDKFLLKRVHRDFPGQKNNWGDLWWIRGVPDCSRIWPDEWQQYLDDKARMALRVGQNAVGASYEPSAAEVKRAAQQMLALERLHNWP